MNSDKENFSIIDNIYEDNLIISNKIDRRNFIKTIAMASCSFGCPFISPSTLFADNTFPKEIRKYIREARYYEKLPHKKIQCILCPKGCIIDDRERGYCGVRENREGTYYTLVYSRPCTYHADPIEKKPLFHFHPGTLAFSIATAGCNVNCKFCQNWQISQVRPEQIRSIYMPPDKVANVAGEYDCLSIAYTYGEPTVFYEYMVDTAAVGREKNIKSVVITAGYINKDPLIELCKKVDAIKVDLKAYSQKFYSDVVNGELKPVLENLVTMRKMNVWTEIVYLVVPTLNDSENEIKELCKWIKNNLGIDVPIHFTRFHPQYLLKNLPSTPIKTLNRAKEIADAEGLHYVYVGNVPEHPAESTYCPKCAKKIINRVGYTIREMNIKNNKCSNCDTKIAGVWE